MSNDNQELEQPALPFRNKKIGGNLLFRPVGILPTIQAVIEIHKRTNTGYGKIIMILNKIDMTISEKPWKNVLWNSNEKTMIMGSSSVVKLMLIYMYGDSVINTKELQTLKEKYADKINAQNPKSVLKGIKKIT